MAVVVTCPRCSGTGEDPGGGDCKRCGGDGEIEGSHSDITDASYNTNKDMNDKLDDILDKCNDIMEKLSE